MARPVWTLRTALGLAALLAGLLAVPAPRAEELDADGNSTGALTAVLQVGGTYSFFDAHSGQSDAEGDGTSTAFLPVTAIHAIAKIREWKSFGLHAFGDVFFRGVVAGSAAQNDLSKATSVGTELQALAFLNRRGKGTFPHFVGVTGKIGYEALREQEFARDMQHSWGYGARVQCANDPKAYLEALYGRVEYLEGPRLEVNFGVPATLRFDGKASLYLTVGINTSPSHERDDLLQLGFLWQVEAERLQELFK